MKNSEKRILELKTILEKQHNREFSIYEAEIAFNKLEALWKIASKVATEKMKRDKILADSPNGYITKGVGNCLICRKIISDEDSWYNKDGFKCLICQDAIKNKIIPNSVAINKDSWYSVSELNDYFNFNKRDLKIFNKQQILKSRTIYNDKGKIYFQLYLMKENKGILPPKNLLKTRRVISFENERQIVKFERWFEYLDEKLAIRISKYEIIKYLSVSLSRPIESWQMSYKLSPIFSYES